jgi:acetamidase/formamidase
MPRHHSLDASPETVRTGRVDRADPPVLTVDSGDTVSFDTWNAWANAVTPETTMGDVAENVQRFAPAGPHDLTGPIEVRGAQPGDVLKVELLDLRLRRHAFNLSLPGHLGIGLLAEEVRDGQIRHYDLDPDTAEVEVFPGIVLQRRPFLGYMGVAPKAEGPHSSIPPSGHGGNIDVPDLTVGSTLYLPVWAPGALFSAGDAHACQGYGEVNLTALEASVEEAVVRFTVLSGGPALDRPRGETDRSYLALAFDESLNRASRTATADLVQELARVTALPLGDAYALCSMALDLKVSQVVNEQWGVQAELPKSIFAQPVPWFDDAAGWRAQT